MENNSSHNTKTLHARIVSGSAVLLTGSGLTTVINLVYNVIIASFLGPAGFGHAAVVYTLLTMLSAVALAFQIVSAKVVAQQKLPEAKAQCYRVFHRAAWVCGLMTALVLLLFQREISNYLNLPDSTLIALLAIGSAFFVPLGSRRGWIQGSYKFRALAINLVLEGASRLGGSYLLVVLGYGVRGVVAANAAAIAVAYFAAAPKLAPRTQNPLLFWSAAAETYQALSFYAGQMLITNFDIVLVKHLFSPKMAGLYCAVALVGRVISTLSSAVVNTMFPLVAGTGEKERKDLRVIATSLLLVLGTGSILVTTLIFTPAWAWTKCLGAGFALGGSSNLSHLAALYAIKSVVYSVSVVFITFEMSYKIANSSAVQLAFSIVLIAGVYEFHSSLFQVILVQLILLSVLVVLSAIPFVKGIRSGVNESRVFQSLHPIRTVRQVSEDEVIGEFLKSEFDELGARECPADLREIIVWPNFSDKDENAKRRALLLLRHLALWDEIPADTAWYEVEVDKRALELVRVFPRAYWRELARGDFSVTKIVEDVRAHKDELNPLFFSKISEISEELKQEDSRFGAVLLLGISEDKPVTVLDGNHRLVAAMLSSTEELTKLRFMCGLSPHMETCCWYRTSITSLFRYGVHLLVAAIRNSKAEYLRTLGEPEESKSQRRGSKCAATSLVEADDIQP